MFNQIGRYGAGLVGGGIQRYNQRKSSILSLLFSLSSLFLSSSSFIPLRRKRAREFVRYNRAIQPICIDSHFVSKGIKNMRDISRWVSSLGRAIRGAGKKFVSYRWKRLRVDEKKRENEGEIYIEWETLGGTDFRENEDSWDLTAQFHCYTRMVL